MLHSPVWAHFVEKLANFGLSEVAAELDGPYIPQKHIMPVPFPSRFPFMSAPPFGVVEVNITYDLTDIVECVSVYFKDWRSLLLDRLMFHNHSQQALELV